MRSMNSIAPVCLVEPGLKKKIIISCLLGTMNTSGDKLIGWFGKVCEFHDDFIDFKFGSGA